MEKITNELKQSNYYYNKINELEIENKMLNNRIFELEELIKTMKDDERYREERVFYGY